MAVLIGIIATFWSITLAIIRTEILPKDLVVTKLLTSDIIILSSPSAQQRRDPSLSQTCHQAAVKSLRTQQLART